MGAAEARGFRVPRDILAAQERQIFMLFLPNIGMEVYLHV
jgi:hypothetical protein